MTAVIDRDQPISALNSLIRSHDRHPFICHKDNHRCSYVTAGPSASWCSHRSRLTHVSFLSWRTRHSGRTLHGKTGVHCNTGRVLGNSTSTFHGPVSHSPSALSVQQLPELQALHRHPETRVTVIPSVLWCVDTGGARLPSGTQVPSEEDFSYTCSWQTVEPGETSVTFLTPHPLFSGYPLLALWPLRALK